MFPNSIAASTTKLIPDFSPFTRPSIIYLGIFSASFNPSIQSRILSIADFTYGAINSNAFPISNIWSTQSRNPTMASPILAVSSKISILAAPKSLATTFIAVFNAPPVIVVIMSITANTPLSVLLSLPAVSSLMDNFLDNSLKFAIISYNCIDVIGGNISTQASFIAVNILTILRPIFLNDSSNKVLPFTWSRLSMNLLNGTPASFACLDKI